MNRETELNRAFEALWRRNIEAVILNDTLKVVVKGYLLELSEKEIDIQCDQMALDELENFDKEDKVVLLCEYFLTREYREFAEPVYQHPLTGIYHEAKSWKFDSCWNDLMLLVKLATEDAVKRDKTVEHEVSRLWQTLPHANMIGVFDLLVEYVHFRNLEDGLINE
jgi:hypothetical protein